MISTRYAWAACALLLVGLVPTVIHVYGDAPVPPADALESRLPATLGAFADPEPGKRSAKWVVSHFGPAAFVSRTYAARADDARIELFAATSYDWKKLFHFPEIALSRGFLVTATRRTEADGLPMHVLEFETSESEHVAVYALLYGGEPVDEPIRHMVLEVPRLFVSARKPMTLLYAQVDGVPANKAELTAELVELIGAAGAALRR